MLDGVPIPAHDALVASTLFEQLTRAPAGRRSRFALTDELVEALSGWPRAVVVDEAQRLNTDCIEFLRYLHDHPDTGSRYCSSAATTPGRSCPANRCCARGSTGGCR